ncbi:disks large homolog 5-like [Peromyscus eremicus]|uniref:disks large homolog 5-like n=1 Tax=Peromyscus eremicus TaxID=42410 RepID=UPI0027DDE2CA|nr:disks large homolog 5-like [Peromyscus eremicus]
MKGMHRIPFGTRIFRSNLNLSGIWFFSGFGLRLSDAGLATESSILGLSRGLRLFRVSGIRSRDGKCSLSEAHHFFLWWFSYFHGCFLRECNHLKKSVRVLRIQNIQLWKEQIELQKTCEEVKKLLKEAHEKICDPCAEQQQEQENLEERLKDLLKQKELVTQQRDLAEKLQHHFSVSEMRSENLHHKLEHVTAQDESLLQTELLQQEQEVSQASEPPLHSNPCNHGIHGDWGLLTLASDVNRP